MTDSNQDTDKLIQGTFDTAAYGGDGWSPRVTPHAGELGDIWAKCGIDSEYKTLKEVLVHRPGTETQLPEEKINAFQFAQGLDLGKAREEHDAMVELYQQNNVNINYISPHEKLTPNQLYCADLFAMTPQGAILARPASTIRAGEERWVAKALGNLGIPILKTLTGTATFEGADLMWLNSKTAVIGRGLRTNQDAIDQISTLFLEMGIALHSFDMPYGTMHFMGMLRIVDKDLAFIWPHRTPFALVTLLRENGFHILPLPDIQEALTHMAFNFVVLSPRKIMLAAKSPNSLRYYRSLGIETIPVSVDELRKANGAVGCMTGILYREL